MSKTVYIVRGLPGSGKSTYCQERWPRLTPASLAPRGWSPVSVSADHFFTDMVTGEWDYDGTKVGQAHSAARMDMLRAIRAGIPEIVVDNTHSRLWEYAETIEVAKLFDYALEVIDLYDGGLSDEELAARNVHDVPVEYIARQRARWEKESKA